MHNADAQCTVGGEGRPKGRKEFLCLNFSCLAINMNFISHNSHLVFSMVLFFFFYKLNGLGVFFFFSFFFF